MTRKDEVTKVNPSFLTEYIKDDTSTESMAEYRVLGRLKVVQGQTDEALQKLVGLGGVALMPGQAEVIRLDDSFLFVPIYQYTEFLQWRDVRDKSGDAIVERSMDRTSELAAMARDPETREVEYDGSPNKKKPYMYRYTENINFVGVIYGDHPLAGTPCALSFSRGEFGQGRAFCSAVMMRKVGGKQAPLWANVFRISTSQRSRGGFDWYGLDYSNPENPFILEEEAEDYRAMHVEFKKLFEENLAGVYYGDRDEEVEDDDEDM